MDGRGCGGDGGVGPTRVSYLCGAGAGAVGGTGARDTKTVAEGGAACLVARGGTMVVAAAGSATGGGPTVAGGEEGLTLGLKEELCPPQVFAMSILGVGEEEWRRKGFSPEKNSLGNGLKRNRMEVRDIYIGSGKVKGL